MNVRAIVLTLGSIIVIAGCGAGPDGGSAPAPSSTSTVTQTQASGDTACLLGRWHLDTDDYASQAMSYLAGLGVPISSLQIGGDQILDFNESPYMSIATNLQLDAVVHGQALSVASQSAGGGEWGWNGDTGSDIGIDNWEWTAEPSATPDGAPPLIDPSQGMGVTCTSDSLTVQGVGAPLAGVFHR